jgi:hypothetical protein
VVRLTTGWKVSRAVVPIRSFSSCADADTRHLDQDPVRALPLDRRLARAGLVDTAAHDLERLLHRPVIRGRCSASLSAMISVSPCPLTSISRRRHPSG